MEPTPVPDYDIVISDGALYANTIAVMLTLTAPVGTPKVVISNHSDFSGSDWREYASSIPWTLTNHGYGTKTVYARFQDREGTISDVYADDIILDVNPPTGAVSVDSQEGDEVILSLPATDDISGVDQMQVSQDPSFADTQWVPYHASYQQPGDGSDPFYARYRDGAGNVSQTYSTNTSVYLPLVIKSSG